MCKLKSKFMNSELLCIKALKNALLFRNKVAIIYLTVTKKLI